MDDIWILTNFRYYWGICKNQLTNGLHWFPVELLMPKVQSFTAMNPHRHVEKQTISMQYLDEKAIRWLIIFRPNRLRKWTTSCSYWIGMKARP